MPTGPGAAAGPLGPSAVVGASADGAGAEAESAASAANGATTTAARRSKPRTSAARGAIGRSTVCVRGSWLTSSLSFVVPRARWLAFSDQRGDDEQRASGLYVGVGGVASMAGLLAIGCLGGGARLQGLAAP